MTNSSIMLLAIIAREMPAKPKEVFAVGTASRTARGFMEMQERILTFLSPAFRAANALSNTSG
jgi:hypothetical protein